MVHLALVCAGLLAGLAGDRIPFASGSPDLRGAQGSRRGRTRRRRSSWRSGARPTASMPSGSSTWPRRCWPTPRTRRPAACWGSSPFGGRWESPEKIGERVKADERRAAGLADYNGRRARLAEKERDLRAAVERLRAREQHQAAFAAQVKGESRAGAGARQPRHVVRAERPEARGHGALHDGRAPRPVARGLLAAPGLREAQRTMDERRAGGRRGEGRPRAAPGQSPMGAAPAEMAGPAGRRARPPVAPRPRHNWRM